MKADVSDLLPNPEDPNFYCRACDRTHSTKGTFRAHCINYHKMYLPPTPKALQLSLIAKFPDIMPDPEDPDFNCCVCQRNYSDKYNFRRHLRTYHKMEVKSLIGCTIKNPYLVPDEDDPDCYCVACEKTFCDRYSFRSHIAAIHNLVIRGGQRTSRTKGLLPLEDDPNGHCRVCTKTLESLRSYRNHLRRIHGMILKPRGRALRVINADITPDEHDPNNYCIACKRQYYHKSGYRVHLETMHGMILQPVKRKKAVEITEESTVAPDPDDPNFHCYLCDKTYPRRGKYRAHLTKCHKMVLKPLSRPLKRVNNPLPEIEDPNFYCRSCNKKYLNKNMYQKHFERCHTMIPATRPEKPQPVMQFLCSVCDQTYGCKCRWKNHKCKGKKIEAPPRNVIPEEMLMNMKPDEDNPDFYCCLCQKNSPDKRTFNSHLRIVHNMNVRSISYSPPPLTGPLPDINDPDFYCNLCKKNLSNADSYYFHLRGVHGMKFSILRKKHDIIPHPEIIPDEFDPNLKCAACEKKFSCNTGFRSHLRKIHKMTLSSPARRKHTPFPHPDLVPDE